MRGAVPAGMCLVLEQAGLMPSFDRIYGCSSGALAGCSRRPARRRCGRRASRTPRAARSSTRAARCSGRPVLDLDYLFETVIGQRRPLSADGLARGPELRALAVSAARRRSCACSAASTTSRTRSPRSARAARSRSWPARRRATAASRSSTAGCSSRSRTAARCARARRTCSCCAPARPTFRSRAGIRATELVVGRAHPRARAAAPGLPPALQPARRGARGGGAGRRRPAGHATAGCSACQPPVRRPRPDRGEPADRDGEHGRGALARAGAHAPASRDNARRADRRAAADPRLRVRVGRAPRGRALRARPGRPLEQHGRHDHGRDDERRADPEREVVAARQRRRRRLAAVDAARWCATPTASRARRARGRRRPARSC